MPLPIPAPILKRQRRAPLAALPVELRRPYAYAYASNKDVGGALLLAGPAAAVLGTSDADMSARAVISTIDRDRVGDEMVPEGCVLDHYRKSPVVFFGHQSVPIPVGLAEHPRTKLLAVEIEPGQRVIATCYFHQASHEGPQFFELVKAGVLRSTSIGFNPLAEPRRLSPIPGNLYTGYRYEKWELLEFSWVGVGANPYCGIVREYLSRGTIAGEKISPQLRKSLEPLAEPQKVWSNGTGKGWFSSFFGRCDRDDEGHCKPEGGGESGKKPEEGKKPEGKPEGKKPEGSDNKLGSKPTNRPTAEVQELSKKYLGGDFNNASLLTGAPGGSTIRLREVNGKLYISVKNEELVVCTRIVGVDSSGKKYIKNEEFALSEKGTGRGTEIFAFQVEQASKHGFAYLTCSAVGGEEANGHYTWPRLGYDQSLESVAKQSKRDAEIVDRASKLFPDAKSVLDIMSTKNGRDWWKENGADMAHATFDLSKGSRSQKILAAYLEERKTKKKEYPHAGRNRTERGGRSRSGASLGKTGQGKRERGKRIVGRRVKVKGDWEEGKHPRTDDGKFGSGGKPGESDSPSQSSQDWSEHAEPELSETYTAGLNEDPKATTEEDLAAALKDLGKDEGYDVTILYNPDEEWFEVWDVETAKEQLGEGDEGTEVYSRKNPESGEWETGTDDQFYKQDHPEEFEDDDEDGNGNEKRLYRSQAERVILSAHKRLQKRVTAMKRYGIPQRKLSEGSGTDGGYVEEEHHEERPSVASAIAKAMEESGAEGDEAHYHEGEKSCHHKHAPDADPEHLEKCMKSLSAIEGVENVHQSDKDPEGEGWEKAYPVEPQAERHEAEMPEEEMETKKRFLRQLPKSIRKEAAKAVGISPDDPGIGKEDAEDLGAVEEEPIDMPHGAACALHCLEFLREVIPTLEPEVEKFFSDLLERVEKWAVKRYPDADMGIEAVEAETEPEAEPFAGEETEEEEEAEATEPAPAEAEEDEMTEKEEEEETEEALDKYSGKKGFKTKRLSRKGLAVVKEAADHLDDMSKLEEGQFGRTHKAACRMHSKELNDLHKGLTGEEEEPEEKSLDLAAVGKALSELKEQQEKMNGTYFRATGRRLA